jgi:vacuolar-type H+-ATPase subunit I/STV1
MSTDTESVPPAKLMVIAGITAVLFMGSLLLTEFAGVPEILGDTDWKSFFIPYLFIALLPYGAATLAVGAGAALGEGILDVVEGYAPDDAFGFVGYIVGLYAFGYVLHRWGDPTNKLHMALAAVFGAFVQILIEGIGYLAVSGDTVSFYVINVAGNTITHGIVLGAIPLVIIYPALHGRIERYLGIAPRGTTAN